MPSVHIRAFRLHDKTRVEHGARRDVHLPQRRLHRDHAVLRRRIGPSIDEHHPGVVLPRHLRRVLGSVGEHGEDRLVVVVEADSEHRRLFNPGRYDSVLEFALQSEPRRKDRVRLHVLAHTYVDADRSAVERKLAEPAVYVAAARRTRDRPRRRRTTPSRLISQMQIEVSCSSVSFHIGFMAVHAYAHVDACVLAVARDRER